MKRYKWILKKISSIVKLYVKQRTVVRFVMIIDGEKQMETTEMAEEFDNRWDQSNRTRHASRREKRD